MCPVVSRSSALIFFYVLSLEVINNGFYSIHQVFYFGPLVHSALDNPKGFTGELQSALGELNIPVFVHLNVMLNELEMGSFTCVLACI